MNPPSPQPADTLEKRRKQIEKAKAAHLSRQLQTRLQYARLKVDHGWQKQTLNEVENLYFHHYRARIPPRSILKAEKSNASTLPTQTASEPPANVASTSQPNHSEQRSPSLPVPEPFPAPNVPEEGEQQTAMDVDPPADASTPADPSITAALAAIAPSPQLKLPSPPIMAPSTVQHPPPQRSPAMVKTPPLPAPPAQNQHPAFSPVSPLPTPQFAAFTSQNSSYPQAQSAPLGSRGPSPPQRPSPSMMPSSSLPGNSNVALTYDSFWSSHSSTSNSYRSALASATPFAPVGKGDGGMGLQNFGASYSFAMGAPAASFQPLPIAKRPGMPRKRTMPAPAGSMGHGLGAAEGGG